MGWMSAIPIVGKIIDGVITLIDKVVPDRDEANRIKAEITKLAYSQEHEKFVKLVEEQSKIIIAEATGGWLQRNWRPILMLVIIIIIANNYIFFPYAHMFWPEKVTMLDLPAELWSLMQIGIGGYIVGRTAEKGIETWKNNSNSGNG
jgi:hypothetical protein